MICLSDFLCYVGVKWLSFSVDFIGGNQNRMASIGGSVLVSQLESTWSLCLCCASWPLAGVRIQHPSAIVNTVQGIESLRYRTGLEYNTDNHKIIKSYQGILVVVWCHYLLNLLNQSRPLILIFHSCVLMKSICADQILTDSNCNNNNNNILV